MSKLDPKSIAKRLGAKHGGRVVAHGGYFGALELGAEVARRFRTPASGGRATDPTMTEQRLVRLRPETLKQLEQLAERVSAEGTRIEPLQLAAVLLEKAAADAAKPEPPRPGSEPSRRAG